MAGQRSRARRPSLPQCFMRGGFSHLLARDRPRRDNTIAICDAAASSEDARSVGNFAVFGYGLEAKAGWPAKPSRGRRLSRRRRRAAIELDLHPTPHPRGGRATRVGFKASDGEREGTLATTCGRRGPRPAHLRATPARPACCSTRARARRRSAARAAARRRPRAERHGTRRTSCAPIAHEPGRRGRPEFERCFMRRNNTGVRRASSPRRARAPRAGSKAIAGAGACSTDARTTGPDVPLHAAIPGERGARQPLAD